MKGLTDEQHRMIAVIGSNGERGMAVVKDKAGRVKDPINIISWSYEELLKQDNTTEKNPLYYQDNIPEPQQLSPEEQEKANKAKKILRTMREQNKSWGEIAQALEHARETNYESI